MRKTTRLLPIAVVIFGCSGSKTTAPTQTPVSPASPSGSSTTYTIQSGETDQPVAGATVTVTGQSTSGAFTATYTSDASGQFILDRTVLPSTTPNAEIRADGYLVRSTLLRTDALTMTLWPSASATGLNADFTETIAYSPWNCPTANEPP